MLFSVDWLRQYVDFPEEIETVARRLTEVGLAVEKIESIEDDVLFDVDVTTNRVDCMNHLGLAREVAAIFDRPLRSPTVDLPPADDEPATRIDVEAPTLCRRYVGRVVRGVTVAPSPEWLVRRLEAIGLRAINNVVDVTNFVLWELGQPLHAFDLTTLEEGRIVVRTARPGETLETLDGEGRVLDESMLVIADARRPVALAGVMGGADTEVTRDTTDLVIESAWFDPSAIRRMARALGMHTDASHRFERGADLEICLEAADRAVGLLLELADGTIDGAAVDSRGEALAPPAEIPLSRPRLDAFAGIEIPPSTAAATLGALGFALEDAADESWRAVVPSWRRFDVTEEADLFEEVLRHFGFDNIPAALPELAGTDAPEPVGHRLRRSVRDQLVASGYAEAVTFAFYSDDDDRAAPHLEDGAGPLRLDNPLSERYGLMRRSLLPGLAASARFNRRRNLPNVRLFELGHAFWRGADDGPQEAGRVAVLAGGRVGSPWEGESLVDFFDLKGVLEALGSAHGKRFTVRPADFEGFVPGRSGELLDQGGCRVGVIGEIAEEQEAYPLFGAELASAALLPFPGPAVVEVPSRFPGVAVDLTLTHARATSWDELAAAIESLHSPGLVGYGLKDRYEGEGVPAGAVNTTIAFLYNAGDRSLTQEEVNERHRALAAALRRQFAWEGTDG